MNPYAKEWRWCRLVSDRNGSALNENIGVVNHDVLASLNPLDIIEVGLGTACPLSEQPENTILDTAFPVVYKKTETIGFVMQFLGTPQNIWGTDSISESSHSGSSLMLLSVNNPKKDKTYKDYPSLNFDYNGMNYNIRCTVKNFLYCILPNKLKSCIICVSSSANWYGAFYKFVASIII